MNKTTGWLCLLGWLLALVVGAQTPVPVGDEFQVNSYTDDLQAASSVGVDADGEFVVSWMSDGSSGTDDSGLSIQAQRFEADATPLGAEFQVNTLTDGFQVTPDLTMQPGGGFTVVWRGDFLFLPPPPPGMITKGLPFGAPIQAQRYAADGSPDGGEFQVDSGTSAYQYDPAIDAAADGSFVVVWDAYLVTGGDEFEILGQRFAADGSADGGEFQVNSNGADFQYYADVGVAGDRSFVVSWMSFTSTGGDSDGSSIQARRFAADGSPLGDDFQVNTTTSGYQADTAIDLAPDGSFVVVWGSEVSSGSDSDGFSIQAQRFAADGSPLGSEFQVNTTTADEQILPDVAVAANGQFAVVWVSGADVAGNLGGRGPERARWRSTQRKGIVPPRLVTDLFGQLYAADGTALGTEFQINTLPGSNPFLPRIGFDDAGDFVVSWESETSAGDDDSSLSIQARRFRTTGDVGDRVWVDENRNGVQDPLEPGFDGVSVHFYRAGETTPTASTTTVGGDFFFAQVPAGDGLLEVVAPAGYAFTSQGSGSDPAADSDVDPGDGRTPVFSIAPAETDLDLDAGLVLIQADLSLSKSAAPTSVAPGETLVYTLDAGNAGPDTATGVVVVDDLPPEVSWVSDTCAAGPPAGSTWTWNVGTLAASAGASCQITVLVDPGASSSFANSASISGNEPDPDGADNAAAAAATLATADVELSKTYTVAGSPRVGSTVVWTLEVHNAGPDVATSLTLSDSLPAEVVWVSDTCGAGPPTAGTLTWNVGDLAAASTASCQIETEIVETGLVSNTATADARPFDPDAADNVATASLSAGPAVAEIPALAPSGMVILIALLTLTAAVQLRRRS